MEPPPSVGSGCECRDTRAGVRSSAVRVLGLQWWEPRAPLSRAAATRVSAEEVWANKRVRIHFGNAVRFGDRIYASNGDFGSAPFAAIDVSTGEMLPGGIAACRVPL